MLHLYTLLGGMVRGEALLLHELQPKGRYEGFERRSLDFWTTGASRNATTAARNTTAAARHAYPGTQVAYGLPPRELFRWDLDLMWTWLMILFCVFVGVVYTDIWVAPGLRILDRCPPLN